jgi:hypothetical protein
MIGEAMRRADLAQGKASRDDHLGVLRPLRRSHLPSRSLTGGRAVRDREGGKTLEAAPRPTPGQALLSYVACRRAALIGRSLTRRSGVVGPRWPDAGRNNAGAQQRWAQQRWARELTVGL